MNDLTRKELEAIEAERAKIFTPQWFGDLLGGRLGFGDSYWLGNFGVLMFAVPAVVLIAGLLYAQAPGAMIPFLRAVAVIYAAWLLGVLRALFRIGPKGGWPIFGMIWTAGVAIASLITAIQI